MRISPAIEDLNRLSETYDWIPNEHTIRPSAEDLAEKRRVMALIEASYRTIQDFANEVGIIYDCSAAEDFVRTSIFNNTNEPWVFKPSNFRYNLPAHSNHYVLWNTSCPISADFDDALINEQIDISLKNIVGHNRFMFAWYKNPKPTIMEFWHVQVFWTSL